MISEGLEALAERLSRYARTGLTLEPEGVIHVEDILSDLAAQARHLEAAAIPAAARLDIASLPANVIRFTPRRPSSGDAA
jgi:hypothetical protein